MKFDYIIILDFGSQYTQLIARRLRELKVYCEIFRFDANIKNIIEKESVEYNLKGIIFSGGPASVSGIDSPDIEKSVMDYIYSLKIPVLGICYGLQLLAKKSGAKIHKSKIREYGHTKITVSDRSPLFSNIGKNLNVWMSHGDSVDSLPEGYRINSKSKNGVISGIENINRGIFGLQFHPEVNHTESGKQILINFAFGVCGIKNLFKPSSFINYKIKEIKELAGNDYAICALSGGVDSSVAARLVQKAIGNKLICVHIDNGLMRKDESRKVVEMFGKNFKFNLRFVNAKNIFLKRLQNITDPEEKRKIIGKTFIDVFDTEAKKLTEKGIKIKYLIQGTLYPDVIESVSFKGPSATIKSHHNVGGLPAKMKLTLIEPFRELFKDEVRNIGRELGIPDEFIMRHPFPGPGLAVRILGSVNRENLNLLRDADEIYINELKKNKLYNKIWQAFSVLLPVQSVGVMGDERSYENVLALRAVISTDGMTADFYHFDKEFLTNVSNKIINNIRGINRVVYDISSKPPATIEWE